MGVAIASRSLCENSLIEIGLLDFALSALEFISTEFDFILVVETGGAILDMPFVLIEDKIKFPLENERDMRWALDSAIILVEIDLFSNPEVYLFKFEHSPCYCFETLLFFEIL